MSTKQRREKLENFCAEISDAVDLIANFQEELNGLIAELKLAAKQEKSVKVKSIEGIKKQTDKIIESLWDTYYTVEDAQYDLPEEDDEESEDESPDGIEAAQASAVRQLAVESDTE